MNKKIHIWRAFRQLQTDFFEIWYDDKDHQTQHFDISLDDLNLHSRSQWYDTYKI